MLLTVFAPRPSGMPYPARVFAAWDEKLNKKQDGCEITLSDEQAEELCAWLAAVLYGIRLRKLPHADMQFPNASASEVPEIRRRLDR